MRLLISVASAGEARAALAGGADIVDAKDPMAGSLGAVGRDTLRAIVAAVEGACPVSAALGDVRDAAAAERAARHAAAERVAYVKLGFAGADDDVQVQRILTAAVRGAEMVSASAGVVAVAYADWQRGELRGIAPGRLIDVAERSGAMGILLDTADKTSGSLFEVMSPDEVDMWVRAAHDAALTVALAGKLTGADLPLARSFGADIVGIRGAACDGGRDGCISTTRVAALVQSAGRRGWSGMRPVERVERGARPATSPAAPR